MSAHELAVNLRELVANLRVMRAQARGRAICVGAFGIKEVLCRAFLKILLT